MKERKELGMIRELAGKSTRVGGFGVGGGAFWDVHCPLDKVLCRAEGRKCGC